MNGQHRPGRGSGWDNAAADPGPGQGDAEQAVDAILRDDALLDALGRGELPAHYRDDVTARLITSWRDDIDEPESVNSPTLALTPVTLPGLQLSRLPLLNAPDRTTAAAATGDLPAYDGSDDRIEEPFRKAFVAAGYARPTDEAPTQQLSAALAALGDAEPDDVPTRPVRRHVRRRRLDRVVVAAAAAAAVIAAGSAGSVAAASTAHPGDVLWPVSRVIYADRAHSIEASEEAHSAVVQAKKAAARGDTDEARRLLAKAKEKAAQVRKGSDEEDSLQDDMASITALTDSLGPPPDGTTDDDGGSDSSPGTSPGQPQPSQRPRRHWGGGSSGQPSSPAGGTSTAPQSPPTDTSPTKGTPTTDPTTDAPTTAPTTDAPTTAPTTDAPVTAPESAGQQQTATDSAATTG